MNQRIYELYEQALKFAYETAGVDAEKGTILASLTAGRFAELIVRECVGVVEGGSFLHDQAPTAIFARECSGAIKKHFGVEE